MALPDLVPQGRCIDDHGPNWDLGLFRSFIGLKGDDDGVDDAENAIALPLVVVGVGLALELQDAA